MDESLWAAVDDFAESRLLKPDPVLEGVLTSAAEAGLPAIHVSPLQGRFLQLLTVSCGARRVLEIGTLAGYSTICLGRGLPPDGRLITLEVDPQYAQIAGRNLQAAGLQERVEIRVGAALETLPVLTAEGQAPFDLIFIDADKVHCADYFEWALKLSRVGTLILTDNVVRKGAILDSASDDLSVLGVRRLYDLLAHEQRVSATTIQTVGSKGYDGFSLARVVNSENAG